MSLERTLSIIKPDCMKKNFIGKVITKLEEGGLRVVALKKVKLTREQAEQFYAIHASRPFYKDLVNYMISGPVVLQVLEGPDAVKKNRDIMGATDPKQALPGTIRREYGESIEANAVHGSDSIENAINEINFFFTESEIVV
jgi:nucleoside-diphosphate kinase